MLSIIIPACNEEKYLEETIKSIKSQSYKNYEIIVVCDGCTDNTPKISNKLADKTIIINKRIGPAAAKNEGAKACNGEKIVFLDADTCLTKNVLKNISTKIDKNPNLVGTCRIQPSNSKLKHKILMFLKNNFVSPFGVSNGVIFCTKKTFDKFNGFNSNLKKGEDGEFVRKIKKHSKFIILDDYVISSTRRFDQKGYIKIGLYWLKEYIKPTNKDYEVIR
ncbi:glycosyltransferase [Candidatus Woesearchaeota archaeon]|nr:glycosyltransferase [Candidatus Woesearchaeota archaeon]